MWTHFIYLRRKILAIVVLDFYQLKILRSSQSTGRTCHCYVWFIYLLNFFNFVLENQIRVRCNKFKQHLDYFLIAKTYAPQIKHVPTYKSVIIISRTHTTYTSLFCSVQSLQYFLPKCSSVTEFLWVLYRCTFYAPYTMFTVKPIKILFGTQVEYIHIRFIVHFIATAHAAKIADILVNHFCIGNVCFAIQRLSGDQWYYEHII